MNAQQQADEWNAKHPIGTKVQRYAMMHPRRNPDPSTTVTRSKAWVLCSFYPVVLLTGYSGGISLDSIEAIE